MKRFGEILERGRILIGQYGSDHGSDYGMLQIPGPCGSELRILASPGDANEAVPWEHVSVSCHNRCPNWHEMCFVKDLCWDAEVTVMQLHPPRSRWINQHPYCLHLWRPLDIEIPLPPEITV